MRDHEDLIRADQNARAEALDVTRSFIVQAPAGSGKTELLIQRYLKLLATVRNPEEVVAITFTRKAAGEMRLRVLEALRRAESGNAADRPHERVTFEAAAKALDRDRELGWSLTEFPRRMRIQTLDALSAGIARSVPLSSTLGGIPRTLADTEMRAIYREAAAATLDWLATSDPMHDFVERVLVHLDNNAGIYIEYVARMLETRDQWLDIVGGGALADEDSPAVRHKLEAGIVDLIGRRLQRLRDLFPAGVGAALMELADYAAKNLSGSDHPIAALAGLADLPASDPGLADEWLGVAELLLTRDGTWRRKFDKSVGFVAKDSDEKAAIRAIVAELCRVNDLRAGLHHVRRLPPQRYSDDQWQVLLALFKLLPLAVSELRRVFAERGVVDHIEVALAANLALGSADDPGHMALLLDYQIHHLLIDEMQDTSISQYDFLQKLVAGWEDGDGRTLFCVGDPMQSIYRFRNAEVGQFLVARDQGLATLSLQPLVLRRNFRSGENLVRWFNETFRRTLPPRDDIAEGAIAYSEAVSVQEHTGKGDCSVHPVFGSDPAHEAGQAVDILRGRLDTGEEETVAVLVRSRSVLPPLLAGLRGAGIAYQAVEIDRLTDLPEIIDVLALTRALCHPGDRIAWLALLRGPWVGLSWQELHRLVFNDSQSTVWELLHGEELHARFAGETAQRLQAFEQTMRHHLVADATRSLRDRVECAWYALGGPAFLRSGDEIENIYRFLSVIEKFEVAGTLADVARLESLLQDERVSSSAGSDCRLQVMTMHRAKGLQFDHVLLYGLGRAAGRRERSVLSWLSFPGRGGQAEMIISPLGPRSEIEHDRLHRYIELAEGDKDELEQDRLLYVACTRARISLTLLGHVPLKNCDEAYSAPASGSLLRRLWPVLEPVFGAAFATRKPAETKAETPHLVRPALRRFARPWVLPAAAPLPGQDTPRLGASSSAETEVNYYWVGSTARHAGTIVHRWLQQVADGAVVLDVERLSELRAVNRGWAGRLGVPAEEVDEICDRVERALRGILTDAKGRWTLYGDGDAEVALTGLWQGTLESIVIDRVRIDEDGTHWIIDYKTSSHEGGDLAAFLEQESQRYRPQLEKYAALYAALGDAPVRVALYFPLLQEFREVSLSF